jgi:hypothetical protein
MRPNSDVGGRVALGFRAHSGWAAMVALRDPVAAPLVVQRRRVELIDQRRSCPAQPYHAAEKLPLNEAEALLQECAEVAEALAIKAVRHAVAELAAKGHSVAGSCILMGSGRSASSLAATLASHTMIHTAEGDFYRDALRKACESCGLAVSPIKEKQVWDQAVTSLGIPREKLECRISELGKSIGPPWRQDEKLSAVAGWIVLAGA